MNEFKCVVPRVLFGAGQRKELGACAAEWGRKAFLALDPFLERSGAGAEIEQLLRTAGLAVVKYSRIDPDPDCFAADEAAGVARREGCDLVVAVAPAGFSLKRATLSYGRAVRWPSKLILSPSVPMEPITW